jgi:hypothetical protein
MKKFFGEFKKFITRGNVLDMAVGVIVGGAFTAIVNGVSNYVLKPIINFVLALIFGDGAFESAYTFLGPKVYTTDAEGNAIVDLAKDLYLTSDPDSEYHQYVYASRLKILASIEAEKLDIVLADREAMDAFAAQGFLMPLESVFADDPQILDRLETGTVILEDNQIDVLLDDSVTYEAVTRDEKAYLDLSGLNVLPGMPEGRPVYIGIIANSPRQDTAVAFVRRLFAE